MKKPPVRLKYNSFVLLFSAAYMVSYITRINYGAVISEMQSATGISKSMLSMALTGSFFTYGIGQIISGLFSDRFSPKKLVLYGLIATVCMNFLIPVCKNPYVMLAVWSINGFAQSLIWPPIVKIMTAFLPEEDYKRAVSKVSYGSSIGTIAVYLLSPLLISAAGWKSVFIFSAGIGVIMILIWNKYAPDVKANTALDKPVREKSRIFFTPAILCILLAIVLQGFLRDGVTTWMPSYISETYHISNEISILTGVVLPIFSIICFQTAAWLYTRKIRNVILCAAFFFGAGILSALGLRLFTGQNAAVSVFMSAALDGCMHGVNLMLICMLPQYFKNTGKVSTVSGILNSCTYIGSALSIYGGAFLSEKYGWSFTVSVWLIIAVTGTALCLLSDKYQKNVI